MNKETVLLILVHFWFVAALGVFIVIYKLFGLPETPELLMLIEGWYISYGVWVVFFATLLEGLVVINIPFPGTAILTTAIVLNGTNNIPKLLLLLTIIILVYFLTNCINYLFGKYGWHNILLRYNVRKTFEDQVEKLKLRGVKRIYATYFTMQLGAIVAVGCGVLQMKFKEFAIHSFFAILIWQISLALLLLTLGRGVLEIILNLKVAFVFFLIWAIIGFIKSRKS